MCCCELYIYIRYLLARFLLFVRVISQHSIRGRFCTTENVSLLELRLVRIMWEEDLHGLRRVFMLPRLATY